jgi:hypothetical protein
MKKVGLLEVKAALKDSKFRDILPLEVRDDVAKYLQNPGCSCNVPIYRRILRECVPALKKYFPGKEITDEAEEIVNLAENNFTVINCHINDVEARLRQLPPGRKQIAVARYEDQATVIVNELDVLF